MLSVQIAVHGCGSRGRTYARIATSFDDRYRITAATDPVAHIGTFALFAFLGADLLFRHRQAHALGQVAHRVHEAHAVVLDPGNLKVIVARVAPDGWGAVALAMAVMASSRSCEYIMAAFQVATWSSPSAML